MKTKIKQIALFGLAACLLFSSCASIINGTKQKVEIDSNAPGAQVYIDDVIRGETPMALKLKTNHDYDIRVSKDGYRHAKDYKLTRHSRKGLAWLTFLLFAGAPLSAYNSVDDQSTLVTGALVLGIMAAIIDVGLGGGYKFKETKIYQQLTPIPPDVKLVTKTLACDHHKFSIGNDEKVGTVVRNKNRMIYRDINWEKENQVADDRFPGVCNRELAKIGYKVPEWTRTRKGSGEAGFFLRSEIYSMDVQVASESNGTTVLRAKNALHLPPFEVNHSWATVQVKWTLVDGTTEQPLLTAISEGKAETGTEDPEKAVLDAYADAIYTLMLQDSVSQLLTGKMQLTGSAHTDTVSVIQISQPSGPGYLNDAGKLDVRKMSQSVITISTDDAIGSGFFISENGYAITNYHIVKDREKLEVTLASGLSLPATVIRSNRSKDLALIRVSGAGFQPMIIGNSDSVELGDDVYAVGTSSSKQLGQSVSKGIVSGLRLLDGKKYIQTDVSVNPGSSGGPLINDQGRVIGVVKFKVVEQGTEGLNFCTPASLIAEALHILCKP